MKLIYEENGTKKTYEVPEAQRITVGREVNNTLQIQHRSVSKNHCEFYLERGELQIKDLGSSNGTYIEGKKITEGAVHQGEHFQIGHVSFFIEEEFDFSQAAELSSEGTVVDENFGQMLMAQEISAAPVQEGFQSFGGYPLSQNIAPNTSAPIELGPQIPRAEQAYLKVISGANPQSLPLATLRTTIGTDSDCTLVLDSHGISGKHAEIIYRNGQYHLTDLNSKNGLYINREKAFEKTLTHGDTIQICSVRLAFDSSVPRPSTKILPIIVTFITFVLLGIILLKMSASPSTPKNATKNEENAVDRYKQLIEKSIEYMEDHRYAEALVFLEEAKRKVPLGSSGALANTLKSVNANLWKEDQLTSEQMKELQIDLEKITLLLKTENWPIISEFAQQKREWIEKQIEYSTWIADAKTAYQNAQYQDAIALIKKVPKDSLLFNSELEHTSEQWREEQEERLIKQAQELMAKYQFRQAIPIIDEAQRAKRKYNTELLSLREICESNMKAAQLFSEAKDRYAKNRNIEALSKLARIPKNSLLYEDARKLKKEIYAIQVKDEILENYNGGNGEHALRLLQEVENEKMAELEKKIQNITRYYYEIDEELGYVSPNRSKMRDAAKAILTLEPNSENWYYQQAVYILENYGDVRGIANEFLADARRFVADKEYGKAKSKLKKILELEELDEKSAEKKEAEILYNSLVYRVSREYNYIVNSTNSASQKVHKLKMLLEAIHEKDPLFLKIKKAVERFEEEAQKEDI